jgi:hypothetical protein
VTEYRQDLDRRLAADQSGDFLSGGSRNRPSQRHVEASTSAPAIRSNEHRRRLLTESVHALALGHVSKRIDDRPFAWPRHPQCLDRFHHLMIMAEGPETPPSLWPTEGTAHRGERPVLHRLSRPKFISHKRAGLVHVRRGTVEG